MAEFGTLARRLPQDPVQPLPRAYPFFRRAEIEDRREQRLTPLEEARILMNMMEKPVAFPAARMSVPSISPLAIEAGMLDVHPSHERWLAERIGALPSSITASAR